MAGDLGEPFEDIVLDDVNDDPNLCFIQVFTYLLTHTHVSFLTLMTAKSGSFSYALYFLFSFVPELSIFSEQAGTLHVFLPQFHQVIVFMPPCWLVLERYCLMLFIGCSCLVVFL